MWADNLSIDFESATNTYSDWTFTNMTSQQTNSNVTAHGGSYFGTTGGKTTASVQSKAKIAQPQSITFYVSKQSTNTTDSNWEVQVSSDGSSWTRVGDLQSATSMTKGNWVEVTRSLSAYSDVYVRIYYEGSTAIRCIDDVTLTYEAPSTATISSIALSGSYKTDYYLNDEFSTEGMTVTATYDDASTKDVTAKTTFSGYNMANVGNQTVTASYTEGTETKTATYQITVSARPKHNVTWSVNGDTTEEEYELGADIDFPANPSAVEGKSFVGWTANPIVGTTNTAPTFVTETTMGDADVTYYAVFATGTGSQITATFDASDISATPAVEGQSLTWADTATGITLKLSAGSRYTSGTPNTFSVTKGTSNYFEITADCNLTKVTTEVTTTDYKINTVSTGASVTQGSTTQVVTFTQDMTSVRCYATSGYQIRVKTIEVEAIAIDFSDYCTTVAADLRELVNMTGFTASATTIVKGGTATTAVTNDQDGWTAAYTYETSDDKVATVSNAGVITAVAKGTATITATLNVAVDDTDYKVGETTSKTIEITVVNASHKAIFYVNGSKNSETTIEEEDAIDFPTVTDVAGMQNVGWTTEEISGTQATADYVTEATMGTADVTYYAVFAAGTLTEDLVKMAKGDNFAAGDKVVIVANVDGDTSYALYQETVSNSYVKNYTFDGKYSTVIADNKNWLTIEAGSTTGKWKLGDATNGYLYNASSNNLSVATDNATEWTLEDNNNGTFGIKGDRYLSCRTDLSGDNANRFRMAGSTPAGVYAFDIYKIAKTGNLSDFCTTVATTVSVIIGESKYATYCNARALDFSGSDVKAYKAKVSENKVVLTRIENDIVPAGTGVILYCETADDYSIPVTTTEATVIDNELVGVTERTQVAWTTDGKYNYILQSGQFNNANGGYLKANRAYLHTNYNVNAAGARALEIVFDDETTGITSTATQPSTEQYYDLQGRLVAQPTKGLYIVNGRKVVIK